MQKALGLSETGEKGVMEMLVVREGKCKISKEEMFLIHETYKLDNHPSFLKSNGAPPCNLNKETVLIIFVISTRSSNFPFLG